MSGVALAVAAGVAAGASIYSSRQQSKAQKRAADQQSRAAAQAKKEQQEQFRKENQNEVDVSGIMGQNQGGGSSTMLSGPKGVDQDKLLLGGGSSLLGG